jgi:UDP-N-acetylglucosamine 1-carboxyvinyltransferase
MECFLIEGPSKLNGEVTVSGSKNAALPIISATLLAKGKYTLENVPDISDIRTLLDIVNDLGITSTFNNNVLEIDTTKLDSFTPNPKKVRNIRASILLAGPLLARFGNVKITHPGGCFIGARPLDTHFKAFESLGAKVKVEDEFYEISGKLTGNKIILKEISVTATENAIMAAVLAQGKTELRLAATEPHVVDLCDFLNKMGAKITGIGTHNLIIEGVKDLKPANHTLIPDQIEAGTFALAIAASRGEGIIHGFVMDHHDILLAKMSEANINYEIIDSNTLKIRRTSAINAMNIRTDIYPNFPTDLQAPFGVLLTQAEGTSEIYETLFEGRLNYINELNKMGANGVIRNSHQATITGPTPLFGTTITSLDLRAGATLIIAAIVAEGTSKIENIKLIDRGYEKIEEKFSALGAKIKRVEAGTPEALSLN